MESGSLEKKVANIIQLSLWGRGTAEADPETYEELKKQAVSALPAAVLGKLKIPDELRRDWQNEVYQQIFYNKQIRYEQSRLPITVPYIILKGTAAAQYYPHPEYRTMGDIDIFLCREDYGTACGMLLDSDYSEFVPRDVRETVRHRIFTKNGITIEVHSYYAIKNDPVSAKFLDDTILGSINGSHVLPDRVNGLVLLEHISQHFEEGLGLRQIIDWMMFVDKCLPDEEWEEFKKLTDQAGLTRLAVVVTRMCEIYLGLPERRWCAGAEEKTCDKVMDYLFSCGNFGKKRSYDEFHTEKYFSKMRSLRSAFVLLQQHGQFNWEKSRKYPFLKPFAWLYQIVYYLKRTRARKVPFGKIIREYGVSRERNALFDELEVVQESKGYIVYKDGKYIKEQE